MQLPLAPVRARHPAPLTVRGRRWTWGERTLVMGVLNVTPDSFSDGGRYDRLPAAIDHAASLIAAGADILDIGGESTRPGHEPVPEAVELERVVPVIEAVRRRWDVPISVDTRKPAVARAALRVGADIVNDVHGLLREPDMATIAAAAGAPVIVMHWDDVDTGPGLMPAVVAGLAASVEAARAAGIPDKHIIVDPGIGFGKDAAGNLQIIRELAELTALGLPILVGPSRKRFIGHVLGLPVEERLEGTAAAVALAIAGGADIVRVHDVGPLRRVAQMADAIVRGL